MENKNFLFLLEGLSRRNGGLSSMLDLAKAAHSRKQNVEVASYGGIFDYLQYSTFAERTIVKSLNAIRRNELSQNSPTFKRYKVPLNLLAKAQAYFSVGHKPSIVIDDVALGISAIERYRRSGAKVWLNHAGSPQAFFSYFLAQNTKKVGQEAAIENYCSFLRPYDGVLFQSDVHCSTAKSLVGHSGGGQFEVLYPSCNEAEAIQAQEEPSPYQNPLNVLIVGSVQRRKGQHLIRSLAENSEKKGEKVNYHIVGNILDAKYFETEVKPLLGSKNIHFHGFRKDYLRFIAHCDILIQLSDKEGFSRVLREAMFLRVPIVTFRIEGWKNIFAGYEAQFIVEPANIQSISENLSELVSSKSNRLKYGNLARANYDSLCAQKKYLQRFSEIFLD